MIKKYEGTPLVSVGIVGAESITFTLNGYGADCSTRTATIRNGLIQYGGKAHTQVCFEPQSPADSFSLMDVVIGVNFHWQRLETQTFRGSLRLVADGGKIWAINDLPVEDYLESVISSEMSAQSSLPLLMAHAVISRSWLMSQIDGNAAPNTQESHGNAHIRWYDHTDHTLFDVCADDHCQRYQGVTMVSSPQVCEAVAQTCGQILKYDGEVCDTRFGKCCGGRTNEFQYCWENISHPYLKSVEDPFCNTDDANVLSQILNDYDLETRDFHDWTVTYTQQEIRDLIERHTHFEFGDILRLETVEAGPGGHISKLRIVGSEKTYTIGKELEIRKTLSETHLKSSAFTVETQDVRDGVPQRFVLHGHGWGHGVGLCQIGAAVMGSKGYTYRQILQHYYQGADIEKVY